MDKGAHYYKCDFQVHTPRDINWSGQRYGVEENEIANLNEEQKQKITEERIDFAKEYLNKIRAAGLNAIAITDHHDVVFAKIIRKVANEENKLFKENKEPEKSITVFPGIEITLSNPASQCLIIFDSDFNDSNLDSVIHFLGIQPSNEYCKKTIQTQRISQDIIKDLVHFHKKLDDTGYCKGKYIILPNVNKSGEDTILRNGFQEHYRKMPCVGGYVDKEISNESGYVNKLNGGDPNYGNKSIGNISTSDNRNENGEHFGKYYTWIKWAEPTAEAIRQACLAKESRISQTNPELPQIFITRIEVTSSKFLKNFIFEFNQQYNSLIGGRGTGKSTILEYLRWGLCDDLTIYDSEEQSEIEKRRKTLIDKTLVALEGEVRISFDLNGILHVVKRNSKTKEILLKIGEQRVVQVKEDDVRNLLSIQAYSQKQLSSVGIRTEELKRFIEQPIKEKLGDIKYQISDVANKTRTMYFKLIQEKSIKKEIEQFNVEIKSLNEQVENLRKNLTGISKEDQEIISKKQNYDKEQNYITQTQNEVVVIKNKIDELLKFIKEYPETFSSEQELENNQLVSNIEILKQKKYNEIIIEVERLQSLLKEENLEELNNLINTWEGLKKDFNDKYEKAKAKSTSNQTQINEIQRIEKKLNDIIKSSNERNNTLKELGSSDEEFEKLRKELYRLHESKIDLLNNQSKEFTEQSKGIIKAEILRNIDTEQIKKLLATLFSGNRIREDRILALIEYIANEQKPLDSWMKVLKELKFLSEIKIFEKNNIENIETPILKECGLSEINLQKLTETLTPDSWINLATTEIEFKPLFKYITNNQMGDEILFSEASAGQQATALLNVLLNQHGTPLIIDQPEDDIDNRAIDEVIKSIWNAKKKRQLIFTSHNANLVVNGDSELVICCDYLESGNQTMGKIKAEGAIDTKVVKDEITAVMEGEKAFRLRKDKYGF